MSEGVCQVSFVWLFMLSLSQQFEEQCTSPQKGPKKLETVDSLSRASFNVHRQLPYHPDITGPPPVIILSYLATYSADLKRTKTKPTSRDPLISSRDLPLPLWFSFPPSSMLHAHAQEKRALSALPCNTALNSIRQATRTDKMDQTKAPTLYLERTGF